MKEEVNNEWQFDWNYEEKGRLTYSIIPNVSTDVSSWFSGYDPRDQKILMRVLLGHLPTNDRLFNMNLRISSNCDACSNKQEDIHHLFFQCYRFDLLRHQTLHKPENQNIPLNVDLKYLFSNCRELILKIYKKRFSS